MEFWQQQGFQSFGDWRRATEKARRDAKRKQAAVAPASTAPAEKRRRVCEDSEAPPATPAAMAVQLPQPVSPPRASPGQLQEIVTLTPGWSRAHELKRTSPGAARLAQRGTLHQKAQRRILGQTQG
jgi:hypothetical protein